MSFSFLKRKKLRFKDLEILEMLKGRVCINEAESKECGYFIDDLVKALKLNVYSYYDVAENYPYKVVVDLNESIYNPPVFFNSPFLIDNAIRLDYKNLNHVRKDGFYVYRSGTFYPLLCFKFDVFIEIKELEAGESDILSGVIVITNRGIYRREFFYQIDEKGIHYYL